MNQVELGKFVNLIVRTQPDPLKNKKIIITQPNQPINTYPTRQI